MAKTQPLLFSILILLIAGSYYYTFYQFNQQPPQSITVTPAQATQPTPVDTRLLMSDFIRQAIVNEHWDLALTYLHQLKPLRVDTTNHQQESWQQLVDQCQKALDTQLIAERIKRLTALSEALSPHHQSHTVLHWPNLLHIDKTVQSSPTLLPLIWTLKSALQSKQLTAYTGLLPELRSAVSRLENPQITNLFNQLIALPSYQHSVDLTALDALSAEPRPTSLPTKRPTTHDHTSH